MPHIPDTYHKPEIRRAPVQDQDRSFLSPLSFASAAAGVVGGGIALVATVEAVPVLAVSGAVIALGGGIAKGIDIWRNREEKQ